MRARFVVPVLAVGLAAIVPAAPTGVAASSIGPGQVLVVGDSLAVGTEPYLGDLLPGREVKFDAVTGRTTPEGMHALRARLRSLDPGTVVISLGTNDGSDPARFASRINRVLDAIPEDTCVVWSTVIRPPRKGAFAGLNRVLRRIDLREGRLSLIDWDQAVQSGHVTLPDTVHPDAAGFQYRSRMFAEAVDHGCSPQPGGA